MTNKAMTKETFAHRLASLSLVMLFVVSSVGCQSSSGSRWAWWNPWSGGSEDTTLLARTAPALPSDSATPLIEGAAPPATTLATTGSAATTAPLATTTNPSLPTIETASTAPAFNSSPRSEAAKIASTPQLASKAATPAVENPGYPIAAIPAMQATTQASTTPAAAGGPYDPNAYQEKAPTSIASTTPSSSGDRYGNLGNRYASSTTDATPDFSYQPTTVAQATAAPSQTATASAAPYQANQTTPSNNSSVGDRYGSYAATPVSPYQPATSAPATSTAASSAVNATESLPSPPSTPVDRYAASTPSYPSTPAVTTPAQSTPRYPVTPSQVAGTATQAAGAIVASNSNNLGSEVRLVSSPGEYRPGGTSTYPSSMNIATKPDTAGSSTATPAYPSSGNRYQ